MPKNDAYRFVVMTRLELLPKLSFKIVVEIGVDKELHTLFYVKPVGLVAGTSNGRVLARRRKRLTAIYCTGQSAAAVVI